MNEFSTKGIGAKKDIKETPPYKYVQLTLQKHSSGNTIVISIKLKAFLICIRFWKIREKAVEGSRK
jgi:hypothetical protein